MNAPTQIWICVSGKEAPDWIVERMTTAEIAANGSFDIEASDGVVKVEPGFAVFEFNGAIYACPPKLIQDKLAGAVGGDNEVVAELARSTEARQEKRREEHRTRRDAPLAKARGDKPLNLKPVIGSPPAPQFVAITDLLVDDSYQRSIEGGASKKLIVKIAENWDWRLCLPLLVSRRDGELFVIDGQHRKEAAELRGDIVHLPVVVFDFDDPKAEAELFVQANRSRRSMGRLDDFHAAVVAGNAKALAVNDLVIEAGLVVGRNFAWQYWKPGEVTFVSAIERALASHGRDVALRALTTIRQAFDGEVLVGVGAIFDAFAKMIAAADKAGKPIDLELMRFVLAETGIPGWKEVVAGVDGAAERADILFEKLSDAYAEAAEEEEQE